MYENSDTWPLRMAEADRGEARAYFFFLLCMYMYGLVSRKYI